MTCQVQRGGPELLICTPVLLFELLYQLSVKVIALPALEHSEVEGCSPHQVAIRLFRFLAFILLVPGDRYASFLGHRHLSIGVLGNGPVHEAAFDAKKR